MIFPFCFVSCVRTRACVCVCVCVCACACACPSSDLHRSFSVPVAIYVEDTDSVDSLDLSCSLDLRRHSPTHGGEDTPPTGSLLL